MVSYSTDDLKYIDDYKVASGGKYKIGKAYLVNGESYYPAQEPSYDREGVASWYGQGHDGRRTANGEIFNSADYTAAHPTLPMPSIVEVTNLSNGRSVNVRVNDRGPFHSKRIIDVSKAAGDALGMDGVARVRVRLLKDQTLDFMKNQYVMVGMGADVADADDLPEEFR